MINKLIRRECYKDLDGNNKYYDIYEMEVMCWGCYWLGKIESDYPKCKKCYCSCLEYLDGLI